MILCQIPTPWNYGDVGTKSLKRSRMDFLLRGIGAINAETLEVIGEEEFNTVVSQNESRQQLKRIAKMMLRMSLVMGLEPVQVDALTVEPLSNENQCLVDEVEPKSDVENFIWFWVGIIICVSVVAWIVFGIVMCRKLYKMVQTCIIVGTKLQMRMITYLESKTELHDLRCSTDMLKKQLKR